MDPIIIPKNATQQIHSSTPLTTNASKQDTLQQIGALQIQTEQSIVAQFSKNPSSLSSDLEKKLKEGPPPELGKFQKMRWTSDMNQQIQDAKEREREIRKEQDGFFAPAHQLLDDLVEKKIQLPKDATVEQVASTFTDCMTNAKTVDIQTLVKDSTPLPKEVNSLKDLFSELSAFTAATFTQEQAKEFTSRYHALGMEVNAATSRYLDEAGTMEPSSCYLVLYHCVTLMLQYHLNLIGTDHVDITEFSKLYALAAATGFAANAMVLNQDYQNRRNNHLAELAAKATAEKEARDQEALRISRRQYLYNGISTESTADSWPLAPYAGIAETILGNDLYRLSDKKLGLTIQRMEETLESNKSAIDIFYRNKAKEIPALVGLREVVIPELLLNLGENLLKVQLESTSDVLLDALTKFMNEHAEKLKPYENRLKQLKSMPPFDLLQHELSHIVVTNMIYSHENADDFNLAATELQQQAQKNIDVAKELIAQKVTHTNQHDALLSLIKRNGELLLLGASAVVFIETEHFLKYLPQFAPNVAHAEYVLRQNIQNAGIDACWVPAVSKHLSDSNTEASEETLQKLKQSIDTNQTAFDTKIKDLKKSAAQWQLLFQWLSKHITQSTNDFVQSLETVLLRSELQGNGDLTKAEYEHGKENMTPLILKKNNVSNVALLQGEDLCQWSGFGDLLKGEETAVMEAIEQALQGGHLPLTTLREVHTINDLDFLPLNEFRKLRTLLRSNIGKALVEWKNIDSLYPQEVRKRLLKELICGTLTKENIHARVSSEEAMIKKQTDAEKLRFLSIMGNTTHSTGEIRYLHLKETASTAIIGDASRVVRRTERFRIANDIWKNIRAENLEEHIYKYWLNARGTDKPITAILESLKEEKRDLPIQLKKSFITEKGLERKTKELDRLIHLINPAQKECAHEFMLRGLEDELLSFTKAGDAFTSHELDTYNKTLQDLEKFAIPRYDELMQTLRTLFGSKSEKVQIYYNNAKKMLAGLEPFDGSTPTEKQKKENRARFGVASWAEALKEISKLGTSQEPLQEQATQAAALLAQRTKQLKNYKGGVLKPFHALILQNQEAFQALMTGEEEGVVQYLSVLERQFRNPYEALRRYDPNGTFAQEFIIEKQALFFDKKEHALDFWKLEAESYYKAYCDYEIKGVSIKRRYLELSENNKTLAPYLMQIIFANPEGIRMLFHATKKNFEHQMAEFEKRITANNTSLKNYLDDVLSKESPEFRTGFQLYLQTKIPFMEPEDFEKNLSKWQKDFQALDAITKQEIKKSRQLLDEQAQTMLAIESKKQKGIEADSDVLTSLENLQNQLNSTASPLLLALGQTQVLTQKEIDAKTDTIRKEYSQYPGIIQDILIESSLSGTTAEQLVKEAVWLSATHKKITTTDFLVGNSSIRIDGDVINKLLMFTFIKWKTKNGSKFADKAPVLPEITEQELQPNFQMLADRHRRLHELAELKIEDAGLQMERNHLVTLLTAGMYSMKQKEFEDLITKRTAYVKASALAITMFLEETANFGKEQFALCSGLREYFHEDLLKGEGELNIPTLREQTKHLLKDETIRKFIKQSHSLMEHVSHTDEIKVSSSHHTLAGKHDLESYLASLPDQAAFQTYSQLDLASRQIFAMALGAPGQEEFSLPTARFLQNESMTSAIRIQMQEQLQHYIKHNTFTPIVDYTRALSQLKNSDGNINIEAFRRAMDFTNVVTAKRLQNVPVDWHRLRDSVTTHTAAKRLMGQTANTAQFVVKDSEEFLDKLNTVDAGEALKLKQELQTLTKHQLQLLIHALTDRTILDRTTKITAWDRAKGTLHEYANREQREELKTLLIHDAAFATEKSLSSQELSTAMTSLMSYQLRDDVTLTSRNIHKKDFANGALERKTIIDWTLLSEALTFVREVEQETFRLNAIKQADVLIPESKNEAAIAEYEIQKNAKLSTQADFEAYLHTQAKKDGMAALYAGYLQLSKQERALFIKALTQRHLLDISKNDIHLNRLGLAEREYADVQSRNLLLDEYMKSRLTQNGTVTLDENAYRQAVYMTLSTQISDDVDFTQMKETSLAAYLTSFSNPFKSVRQTAVDWKLVQRALQFVHRASNENAIFRQDRELYVSQGNLLQTGHFAFDATHLRKNIHNSGNRFGRYLSRRVQEHLADQIPAYLKPLLDAGIKFGRVNLSATHADEITKRGFFDDEEDTSITEKASSLLEWEDSFYGEFLKGVTQKKFGEEKEQGFRDKMETLSSTVTYIDAAVKGVEIIHNFYQLNQAKNSAANDAVKDEQQTEAARKHQTMQQQDLSKQALARNFNLQEQGRSKSQERQVDTIIDTATEVVSTAAIENNLLETIVTESGKLINFIRNYINDKSSIVKFFKENGELEQLRKAYNDMEWDVEKEQLSDIELIRQMKGYENYTELADFVGLNITRSLLFCASKYNPQKHLHTLAVATLTTLGMEDAIGQQDAETAEQVFQALMGSEYR